MYIALKMTFYLGSETENGMCHTGKGAGGGRRGGSGREVDIHYRYLSSGCHDN